MKELSIEEKAKRYDEAKARMSRAFNSNRCTIGFMNEIFPELRENWNERIRTKLIEFFSDYNTDEEWWGNITEKDILAWLEKQGDIPADAVLDSNKDGLIADTIRCKIEKQGEQKFAEWTAEDEEELKIALNTLEEAGQYSSAKWLKNVCLVPQTMQKPTAWSEEDEKLLNDLSDTYFYNDEDYPEETYKQMLKRVLDWMNKRAKSLRSQNTRICYDRD